MELFAEGKIDAFLGFPPEPQELRARKIGQRDPQQHDRPALVAVLLLHAGRQPRLRPRTIRSRPSACVRAILKAADICAAEPERVAQRLVDGGFTTELRLRAADAEGSPLRQRGASYDPEDTMRFYALRLHEVGMIKSSPNKIIAEGTDWRFLNELKRELKA